MNQCPAATQTKTCSNAEYAVHPRFRARIQGWVCVGAAGVRSADISRMRIICSACNPKKMATAAGGIPPPAGDGASPQAHPAVVSGPSMVLAGDQKPHFVAPTSNVRQVCNFCKRLCDLYAVRTCIVEHHLSTNHGVYFSFRAIIRLSVRVPFYPRARHSN